MKQNQQGFSIIIGMSLVVLMSLSAYVILSFIMPFARNMKGIDNSTSAHYLAYAGVETGLYDKKFDTGALMGKEHTKTFGSKIDYKYTTTSSGRLSPPAGQGNSEYSKDYNRLGLLDPIQMEIGYGKITNWSNVGMYLRVPTINGTNGLTMDTSVTTPLIYWTLSRGDSSTGGTLMASGSSIITSYDTTRIISSGGTPASSNLYTFSGKTGLDLEGASSNFDAYYSSHCTTSSCILKITVLQPIQIKYATSFAFIPYLESKLSFGSNTLPLYYTVVNASGISQGFKRDLNVRIPQQTVNQAFDFTVFQ